MYQYLTFHDGVVAAAVEEYAHGAVTAAVYLVSLNVDRRKRKNT